ncbi:MAG: NADH-quinone oxidoreductase subunit G [Propionibacteriaceae bacterium]|jgi:NADH-quinone oxidoreductase subunit G|nr:NADH-quinone oxidoreductase subunit G [Propionibacteriaceae bacterium]
MSDDMVTLSIDGLEVSVPKGTHLIRAAEAAGIAIPRFCDHPLLDPVGACRQCLVEITDAGNGRGFPKPQPSCTTEAANGMVALTGASSAAARQAQADILELLLINHPLDCPVCDKGGECPLQNQALADGRGETRFTDVKRTYPTPTPVSELILLDRERCVLCTRCTRFADQIAGDPTLALVERGAKQQVGIYPDEPFHSYFSGNVVQICPVGALTSADYRFSARPFDLVSTATTCENCASGCQLRVDARHFEVKRRYAGEAPDINEEWSCDRGRFGFVSARGEDRLTRPLVRRGGELQPVTWPEALAAAVAGLTPALGSTGVLTGGRLTLETAYAYSTFARKVLRTHNIDFRSRLASDEEAAFLAAYVVGRPDVTYADLDRAARVVLVAFEPEEESPAVFLRLRKAVRKGGLKIATIAPYRSRGAAKLGAELLPAGPADVVNALAGLTADENTILLVGERLAATPGGYSALAGLLGRTGARLAWIPRRAGEIGALVAGCLPGLLPGARPVDDPEARAEVAKVWGELPAVDGLDVTAMIAAAASGRLRALVTSGIEAADFADPALVAAALKTAFVVSLETRLSQVAAAADVVLPVDLLEQQVGTFLNWEHRTGAVNQVVDHPRLPMTEVRVLAALAAALGTPLGFATPEAARAGLLTLPRYEGERASMLRIEPETALPSGVVLASWRELLDDSRLLDGAGHLVATAPPAVARISPQTRRTEGLATSTFVRLTGPKGSVTFPLVVTPTMVDDVIWVPARARDKLLADIGVDVGGAVTLSAAPDPKKEGEE